MEEKKTINKVGILRFFSFFINFLSISSLKTRYDLVSKWNTVCCCMSTSISSCAHHKRILWKQIFAWSAPLTVIVYNWANYKEMGFFSFQKHFAHRTSSFHLFSPNFIFLLFFFLHFVLYGCKNRLLAFLVRPRY